MAGALGSYVPWYQPYSRGRMYHEPIICGDPLINTGLDAVDSTATAACSTPDLAALMTALVDSVRNLSRGLPWSIAVLSVTWDEGGVIGLTISVWFSAR